MLTRFFNEPSSQHKCSIRRILGKVHAPASAMLILAALSKLGSSGRARPVQMTCVACADHEEVLSIRMGCTISSGMSKMPNHKKRCLTNNKSKTTDLCVCVCVCVCVCERCFPRSRRVSITDRRRRAGGHTIFPKTIPLRCHLMLRKMTT